MLTHIHIKNFAIVDELEIEFYQGLCILTGETGAGKSLWVDAVNLTLGQRAEALWIRNNKDRAEISVTFNIINLHQAQQWLLNEDIEHENQCILRRILVREGTSRCSINGVFMPLQKIRELSQHLIQVHSQHQHSQLLSNHFQRDYLDQFAGSQSLLKSIQTVYQQWKITHDEINALKNSSSNKTQEIEFLRYQLEELTQVSPKSGEWQTLTKQHQQLHNAKEFINQINQALSLTVEHDDLSASQLVQQALQQLDLIKLDDTHLDEIRELLKTAAIHLNEAGTELQNYRDQYDTQHLNLDDIEDRMSIMYDLSRKHHCNPEDLIEIQSSIHQKLDTLLQVDDRIKALEIHLSQLNEKYQQLAKRLTTKRKQSAKILENELSENMKKMDIHDGEVKIDFQKNDLVPSAFGNEKICFLVQTNLGQGFQPLNKIASGGELSRISLALNVLIANKINIPTLVFDEVDVGISGKTAATVGKLLRLLGNHAQVLCITHLAQVAANGHEHYKAFKETKDNETVTRIKHLNQNERVDEIARLIGGSKITKQTLANATELLTDSL